MVGHAYVFKHVAVREYNRSLERTMCRFGLATHSGVEFLSA